MKRIKEDELIELNRQGYNRISSDFRLSRPGIWPELRYFSQFIEEGDSILDLGCGHGRLINLLKDLRIDYHGLDYSAELVKIARKENPGFIFKVGDARELPYGPKTFDSVWLIALLHHLNPKACLKVLKESRRVLKPSGKIIITIWQPHKEWTKSWQRIGSNSFLNKWGGKSWLYYYRYHPKKIKSLIKKAGLLILEEGHLIKKKKKNYFIVACKAPIA